jgi:hypothetical protein
MGGKGGVPVKIPISTATSSILMNKTLVACLNASDEVIALYKITDTGAKVLLTGKEAAKALNTIGVGVSQGVKGAAFVGKGF